MLVSFPDRIVESLEVGNLLGSLRSTQVEVSCGVTVIPFNLDLLELALNVLIFISVDNSGFSNLLANYKLWHRIVDDFFVDASHPGVSAVGVAVSEHLR
jgi:hypothetical protein